MWGFLGIIRRRHATHLPLLLQKTPRSAQGCSSLGVQLSSAQLYLNFDLFLKVTFSKWDRTWDPLLKIAKKRMSPFVYMHSRPFVALNLAHRFTGFFSPCEADRYNVVILMLYNPSVTGTDRWDFGGEQTWVFVVFLPWQLWLAEERWEAQPCFYVHLDLHI